MSAVDLASNVAAHLAHSSFSVPMQTADRKTAEQKTSKQQTPDAPAVAADAKPKFTLPPAPTLKPQNSPPEQGNAHTSFATGRPDTIKTGNPSAYFASIQPHLTL